MKPDYDEIPPKWEGRHRGINDTKGLKKLKLCKVSEPKLKIKLLKKTS